jgi:dTDP-glucose pyrophosphorylase
VIALLTAFRHPLSDRKLNSESIWTEIMWGIIPAAGSGSRIQPLAFSKELLPIGSRVENGSERPRAVSEYLVERMIRGGADKLCFIISPSKADILHYYGSRLWGVDIVYAVQQQPGGLCDAVFRASSCVRADETVAIGLPDTIWFPEDALMQMPDDALSLLLFPVEQPELFDAVVCDERGMVREVQVKQKNARSHWVWGAIKMPGYIFHHLHKLWLRPERRDEYFGSLFNAWIREGGTAVGVHAGRAYVDVGTLHGYRAAIRLLDGAGSAELESNEFAGHREDQVHAIDTTSR